MVCPHRPQMTQVQHWAKMAQTDHVTLQPWPLPMEVMAHVADVGRRRTSVYHVWSPCALPFGRYGTRCVSALIGVMTLTFDLETGMRVASKLGNVPSKFGHAGLWVLELFVMYATDGQTKTMLIVPFPMGGGTITAIAMIIQQWKSPRPLLYPNLLGVVTQHECAAFCSHWLL